MQAETVDRQHRLSQTWTMHDHMTYLDGVDCFELIAESWEALTEASCTWT